MSRDRQGVSAFRNAHETDPSQQTRPLSMLMREQGQRVAANWAKAGGRLSAASGNSCGSAIQREPDHGVARGHPKTLIRHDGAIIFD